MCVGHYRRIAKSPQSQQSSTKPAFALFCNHRHGGNDRHDASVRVFSAQNVCLPKKLNLTQNSNFAQEVELGPVQIKTLLVAALRRLYGKTGGETLSVDILQWDPRQRVLVRVPSEYISQSNDAFYRFDLVPRQCFGRPSRRSACTIKRRCVSTWKLRLPF
jgi:hypothetical protein